MLVKCATWKVEVDALAYACVPQTGKLINKPVVKMVVIKAIRSNEPDKLVAKNGLTKTSRFRKICGGAPSSLFDECKYIAKTSFSS